MRASPRETQAAAIAIDGYGTEVQRSPAIVVCGPRVTRAF
jgi:hypothetical protein